MKQLYALLLMLVIAVPVYTQEAGVVEEIEFTNNLAVKKTATVGDAVKLFALMVNETSLGFQQDLEILNRKGILGKTSYSSEIPVRKGIVALMAARYLKLGDSLLFKIFRNSGRYAYKACVAAKVMDYQGSELEKISGGELLEIMGRISERAGGEQ